MTNKGRPSEREREREKVVQALHPEKTKTWNWWQVIIGGQAGPVGQAADPITALQNWASSLPPDVDLAALPSIGIQRVDTF